MVATTRPNPPSQATQLVDLIQALRQNDSPIRTHFAQVRLDRERTELFEQAKEEALRRATQAVEDLNALGLKYRLVETGSAAGTKGAGKKPQPKPKS